VGRIASLLLLLGVGTLTLYLLPRRVGRIAQALEGGGVALARLFLVGVAGYIVLAALSVLGAITLFGAPAGLLLLVLAYALVPLGLAAISLPLGRAVGRRCGLQRSLPLVDLLAGLLILFILSLIPLLGPLLLLGLAILGFGAVVLTRAGSAQGWDFDLSEVRY
jgi:hypothetical protein